jgi:DNA-directed RNA polymerase subunit RPC12/RpoP
MEQTDKPKSYYCWHCNAAFTEDDVESPCPYCQHYGTIKKIFTEE